MCTTMAENKKNLNRKRRAGRVRAKISGTAVRPRVSVFRSHLDVRVQVIDDLKGVTLASGSLADAKAKNTVEGAGKLGTYIAKECGTKKITEAVFDRNGYRYHGKVKAVADAIRDGGIKL